MSNEQAGVFSLSGKTAVVTGGASGIGRSISVLFAKQGAHVEILDMDEQNAQDALAEIAKAKGSAQFSKCDVSNGQEVAKLFARIHEQHKLDILVNNAGVAHIGNIEQTEEADMDRIYSVNVKGVYHCARAAIRAMKGRGGVILNMASIASLVAVADRFAYSMSKGAVFTMTQSIAQDYLNEDIRCNCIAPARIHTPFVDGFLAKNYPGREAEMFEKLSKSQPIGRMGTPEEVAALALYLCSDEASFITGSCYPIDGGFIHLNS